MTDELNNKLVILARGQQEIRADVAELKKVVDAHDVVIKEMTSTHSMTKDIHTWLLNLQGFFRVMIVLGKIIKFCWFPAVIFVTGLIAYYKTTPK